MRDARNRHFNSYQHRTDGFTIIEVVIALLMISILVAGVMFLVTGSSGAQTRAKGKDKQNAVAEAVIEEMRSNMVWAQPCTAVAGCDGSPVPGVTAWVAALETGNVVDFTDGETSKVAFTVTKVTAVRVDSADDNYKKNGIDVDRDGVLPDFIEVEVTVDAVAGSAYASMLKPLTLDATINPSSSANTGAILVRVCRAFPQVEERKPIADCPQAQNGTVDNAATAVANVLPEVIGISPITPPSPTPIPAPAPVPVTANPCPSGWMTGPSNDCIDNRPCAGATPCPPAPECDFIPSNGIPDCAGTTCADPDYVYDPTTGCTLQKCSASPSFVGGNCDDTGLCTSPAIWSTTFPGGCKNPTCARGWYFDTISSKCEIWCPGEKFVADPGAGPPAFGYCEEFGPYCRNVQAPGTSEFRRWFVIAGCYKSIRNDARSSSRLRPIAAGAPTIDRVMWDFMRNPANKDASGNTYEWMLSYNICPIKSETVRLRQVTVNADGSVTVGAVVATGSTDGTGSHVFDNLKPDTYQVELATTISRAPEGPPPGWPAGTPHPDCPGDYTEWTSHSLPSSGVVTVQAGQRAQALKMYKLAPKVNFKIKLRYIDYGNPFGPVEVPYLPGAGDYPGIDGQSPVELALVPGPFNRAPLEIIPGTTTEKYHKSGLGPVGGKNVVITAPEPGLYLPIVITPGRIMKGVHTGPPLIFVGNTATYPDSSGDGEAVYTVTGCSKGLRAAANASLPAYMPKFPPCGYKYPSKGGGGAALPEIANDGSGGY